MAHLHEILQLESVRTTDNECRMVHLFKEGTFYRAYEWSAWLLVSYISPFKATRRMQKGGEDCFVFVGFPITSLSKFVPDGVELVMQDDQTVHFSLPVDLLAIQTSAEQLTTDFQNWKPCVPMAESKKQSGARDANMQQGKSPRITDVMHQIMSFPVEQKSPIDCMLFLAQMKQELSAIF